MRNNRVTKLSGLIVFIVSLCLYTFTLEPTTSFWDCSEFILSAAKLEVNHPAGAPLFMLLGRLFSFLSFGNPEKVAWSVNFMSGFFSALTVFFLFHIIVKLIRKETENQFLIIGSALLGALSFAVSDSFWFSAVEGEVYSLSMFFLVLSFWAALKWDEEFEQKGNEKWIYFLALITGLGLGVHLLNLLVLPTVVMVLGFRKYGYSIKNLFLFFVVGLVLLLGVLYVLTPIVMKTLAWFDYAGVNKLSLQVHFGAILGVVIILSLFGFAIFYFRKNGKSVAEITALSTLLILIGFSVYSVNIIRSSANPPINFGGPNNMYSLINYLNREQYPKRPLFHGQNYNSPITKVNERYTKDVIEGKYRTTQLPASYEFDSKTTTFFPRMYSREERHIQAYNSWVDIQGKRVSVKNAQGERKTLVVPRLSDHVAYFLKYQFGYMFGRYFMWNFVGRQNDRQGRGDVINGNWISGIDFIDTARLGAQGDLPEWLRLNKARNTYFFLPLLLGLFGAFLQNKRQRKLFFVVLALFIMGGLGLTVYINEIPITPRERDYVFVGAFMAFSIWIGYSFLAIVDQFLKNRKLVIPVFVLFFLAAPGLMGFQNYDDHNRSGKYAARDFAVNILKSCPENAILFTSADNDTYPLLYCQEVEGIRTDVRVVVMPFLSANWFIDGLRQPKYNDSGLKMTIPQLKYDYGQLDYIPVLNKLKRKSSWSEVLKFLQLNDDSAKVRLNSGEKVNFLPVDKVFLQVKVNNKSGSVPINLDDKILYKHQLVFWDIISSNIGERPVCFSSKYEAQKHGLGSYLECEGFVYRLIPEQSNTNGFSLGKCNAEELYEKLTQEYNWGNISDMGVYVCWNTITNFNVFQARNVYTEVAGLLLNDGKSEKAKALLNLCVERFPVSKIPHDIYCIRQAETMFKAGMKEEAELWFEGLEKNITESLYFYQMLNKKQQLTLKDEIQRELMFLNQLIRVSSNFLNEEKMKNLENEFARYYNSLIKS